MNFEMWVCLFCDRAYIEPDYDRDNFGTPICPYCGRPHWDNSAMDIESVSDLIEGRKIGEIMKIKKKGEL